MDEVFTASELMDKIKELVEQADGDTIADIANYAIRHCDASERVTYEGDSLFSIVELV